MMRQQAREYPTTPKRCRRASPRVLRAATGGGLRARTRDNLEDVALGHLDDGGAPLPRARRGVNVEKFHIAQPNA